MPSDLLRTRKRTILAVVGVAVSLFLTYVAIRDVQWSTFWLELRRINYFWILPSGAALALAFWLKALRWRMLFAPETRPRLRPLTSALLIGHLFNNILPARAGEAARFAGAVVRGCRTRAALRPLRAGGVRRPALARRRTPEGCW